MFFDFELEDNEIQVIEETQPPVRLKQLLRGTIHTPLKRPLQESAENILPNKQSRATSALEDYRELKKQCTFLVTAEVHQQGMYIT